VDWSSGVEHPVYEKIVDWWSVVEHPVYEKIVDWWSVVEHPVYEKIVETQTTSLLKAFRLWNIMRSYLLNIDLTQAR